jgi:orotidine-5'-phosphate decarboxylase
MITQKLDERMAKAKSLVCVGLDPDISKIPNCFHGLPEERIEEFLTQVVNITHPHVCAYKIQKAFFDRWDGGHALLRNLVRYIIEMYSDIPVFVDGKSGDVYHTMEAYINSILFDIGADGMTVNPYMGLDVIRPFFALRHKAAIVLVQTSNPDARVVQELQLRDGRKVWEAILDYVVGTWNDAGNLIPVLSANSQDNLLGARQKIPQDMPILLAGYGSQGGSLDQLKYLKNKNGRGVFVGSSRGILYPYSPSDKDWKQKILEAVVEMKEKTNE